MEFNSALEFKISSQLWKRNFILFEISRYNKTALHFQLIKENAMPLFFLVLWKYILSPKCISPVLQGLSPWVNQFPYTHSTETETHIYFRPKSAETFDLPGISRQQSDRLNMRW